METPGFDSTLFHPLRYADDSSHPLSGTNAAAVVIAYEFELPDGAIAKIERIIERYTHASRLLAAMQCAKLCKDGEDEKGYVIDWSHVWAELREVYRAAIEYRPAVAWEGAGRDSLG